ncbi:tripartite tricarboxylate transporter substrate binding protein [Polynucleobacter sp. MWH-Aus1W21]|jgi:tripartite-type tricarboxylate transporter receptor subunit TctC|uniref:Bug family tripartite tricarboxylate transporter substrate binding protein n=1 Tax=Polynucleobacter sp. MWH-Aus1W21 TaxID=1855880 RepID=UPI001BFEBE06|nr:tripartite tricarboxylate transporter substrate binding protein [Polynucleobacter sp. MWH-Aus1W21]QWD65923.1 tripartite tricarboxylate transporter substrate binding protein [Polynucleobacter sp. MWH-Aus1W21]
MKNAITNKQRRLMLHGCLATTLATYLSASFSQSTWPQKPIRFIVPFVPGGTSDIVARTVGQELSRQLPYPVILENKAGGGGVPAMQEVAKSAPDGYTMILGHVGSMAVNPYIFSNTGYDVNKDFAPVTLLATVPSLFVVNPELPVENLKELIAYAKNNPGKLNYGSAGNASAGHLAMEYLKLTTGMDITHIPYKGTGPALTDLLAGRIQVFSAGTPALLQYIRSGKLRAIAVGTPQRIASLPNVPTVAESGYKGFESVQWYGILVPAKTPKNIIKRIQEESYKALRTPAVAERFASEDAVIGGGPPAEFAALIAQQQRIWKEVVLKANIRAD